VFVPTLFVLLLAAPAANAQVTQLTLTPSVAANLVANQHCVTAHAEDTAGPLPSASIVFSVSAPNTQNPTPVPTDGNGNAGFCYVGTQVGTDTITAFADSNGNGTHDAGELQRTATKRWLANQPAVALAPPSASNRIGSSHTLTATVSDAAGPVVGVNVLFRVSGVSGNGFIGCAEDTDHNTFIRTDASGEAKCTYTGGQVAGLDTITAWADTNNNGSLDTGEGSATATKSWTTTSVATLTLTPSVAANTVATQHCVIAHAEAAGGTALPSASVVFSVSAPNTQPPTPVPTDGNGNAGFCYVGTQIGTDTITAFADNNGNGTLDAGEPQPTATKRWLASQPAIALNPPSATNPRNSPHTLTATVTDATGPVVGVNVLFALSGPNGNGFIGCAEDTDHNTFIRTDASGEAKCTYTGTQDGTDTITAWPDTNNNGSLDTGESSATATKTWGGPAGTIEVKKQLSPTTDPGHFDLQIDGATRATNAGHNSTTGPIRVAAGRTHSVGELASSGTTLADYTSQIACTRNGVAAESGSGSTLTGITVTEGDAVECTITNTRQGTIEVKKALSPTDDAGRFDLQIDNATHKASAGNNDTTGAISVATTGTHSVGELAASGTSLTNYDSEIACTRNGGAGPSGSGTSLSGITVAANDVLVCTITNTREIGTIEVKKSLSPTDDPGRFDLQIDGTTRTTNVGNDGTTGTITVPTGTNHSVGETAAGGTSLADYSTQIACSRNGSAAESGPGTTLNNITVGANDTVVCAITNTHITARPKEAPFLRAPLVPAYDACASPNSTHGAPLSSGSCTPPQQASNELTVGTPDANGKSPRMIGSVDFKVKPGDPATPADEADVMLTASLTDVRVKSDLSDYTGELQATAARRITDLLNGAAETDDATVTDEELTFIVPCAATGGTTDVGATCSVATTADTLVPGTVREGKLANWQLDQVKVYDGGPDGIASTPDNKLFAVEGVFVP
jgi:hypothetical protein